MKRGDHVVCAYIYCTNVFPARHKLHRFCCKRCQDRSLKLRTRKTPFERTCERPECGKLFRPYHAQRYCSYSCQMSHHYEVNKKELLDYRRDYHNKNRATVLEQKRKYDRSRRDRKKEYDAARRGQKSA